MAERTVGGEVDIDYAPSGVTWRLTCPAANALGDSEQISKDGPIEVTEVTAQLAKSRCEQQFETLGQRRSALPTADRTITEERSVLTRRLIEAI